MGRRRRWKDLRIIYHFDYLNDNDWLAEKEFLEKHGATLVFFPYTEQTSSTKIKALIDKRLEKDEREQA